MAHAADSPVRVSVVVPCFNAADFVEAAVRSVLSQTLADLECLVIDDCSTDSTPALLARLAADDPRVRVVTLPDNAGPSAARNAGIDAARGEWIALLDADDAYLPHRLERLIEAAEPHDADMMADNQIVVGHADGRDLGRAFNLAGGRPSFEIDLAYFLEHSIPVRGEYSLGYLKPIMRRAFLDRYALRYDRRYTVGEDFLLYVDALRHGARFHVLDEAFYLYTNRPASLTRSGGWTLRVLAGMSREILDRHGPSLPQVGRLALAERHNIMMRRALALDLAGCVRAGDPRGAAALIVREPAALAALGRELLALGRYRLQLGYQTSGGTAQ